MNAEFELQLQAYLDGELSESDAREMSARLAGDPQAQALWAELTTTKRWLAGNEPVVALPESRDFYWSKIERALNRLDPAAEPAAAHSSLMHWLRFLAPAAGVALAIGSAVLLLKPNLTPTLTAMSDAAEHFQAETETLSEHMSALTFCSQRENMLVVWISNKEPAPSTEAELPPESDFLYQ